MASESHHKVASLDIDARQGTLTRYIENRRARKIIPDTIYPYSHHEPLFKSDLPNRQKLKKKIGKNLSKAMGQLDDFDYVVIDTPGGDNFYQDLLILMQTPYNSP